ncbi:uncharacterized protein LOC129220987 [Uloborus diversus]|uniref:uncharacterized protein LOC129220987 n=1 Tax=Uloborus diversus TaxID=327109 RepID=UPI002409C0BE|nr:uncharacterized protein LOC129220987 [Uloborus diversus]
MDSTESKLSAVSTVDDMDIETVELHRAESMVQKSPPEIIEKVPEETSPKKQDVYSQVATWAIFLFNEIKDLKLEVVMFLYTFSITMRHVSSTSMILDKVCLVHLGLSPEICSDLANNQTLKNKVEKLTTNYVVGHSLIQLIPSTILSAFIGPWSDKYGRKIPIIAGLLGIIADGLGSATCAAAMHSRVEFLFIPPIFAGLSGATGSIGFLYAHHRYDWDNTKYSTVTSFFAVFGVITTLISVPLFKYFKFGDPTLGLVGSASLLAKNILIGLAASHEFYYLANLVGLLMGLGSLAARSRISKVVSKDDLGKVFAFLSSAETVLPIVAVAFVSQIFNATLDFLPGLVYLVLGGLMAIPIVIYIWLMRLPNVNYEEMHDGPQSEEGIVIEIKASEKR